MEDLAQKERNEEKMINDAFQHLIDTYLASRHRKKVEVKTDLVEFQRDRPPEICSGHLVIMIVLFIPPQDQITNLSGEIIFSARMFFFIDIQSYDSLSWNGADNALARPIQRIII